MKLGAFALIAILFYGIRFSSLIYQVVWTRMLALVFGSTTYATATVLAVFMGGLALGSFLAAQVADRIKRPFLWYGILEGLIGIWALFALPCLIRLLRSIGFSGKNFTFRHSRLASFDLERHLQSSLFRPVAWARLCRFCRSSSRLLFPLLENALALCTL